MCVFECEYMCINTVSSESIKKRVSDPWKPELQRVMAYPRWILGIELGTSLGAANIPNY